MGLLDLLLGRNTINIGPVPSIMPDIAKNALLRGSAPNLNVKNVFLAKNESCCYYERAVLLFEKQHKQYVRNGGSYSVPGLFRGNRISYNRGRTDVRETTEQEAIKGHLYITNQRIIFAGPKEGFSKKLSEIIAAEYYENAIEIQFKNKTQRIYLPDGNVIANALSLVK
ncbi:MAG: hypothetical protein LBN08_00675 [Lactobacillales bacterium]|jgi:hypothetical protein|nr:hypothetical protein [Lactobacillales bacterium]